MNFEVLFSGSIRCKQRLRVNPRPPTRVSVDERTESRVLTVVPLGKITVLSLPRGFYEVSKMVPLTLLCTSPPTRTPYYLTGRLESVQ